MATDIRDFTAFKATPVISGKDAVRFYKQLEEDRHKVYDKAFLDSIENAEKVIESWNLRERRV